MSDKRLYAVIVNTNDTLDVVSVAVLKETPHFYMIEPRVNWGDADHRRRSAFGFSNRVQKYGAHTTARAALETYMAARQRDKAMAQSTIAHATKQIASANELLMHLPVTTDLPPVGA